MARSGWCFLGLKPKADARELNFAPLEDFVGFSDKEMWESLTVFEEDTGFENHQPRGEGSEVIEKGRSAKDNGERWIYAHRRRETEIRTWMGKEGTTGNGRGSPDSDTCNSDRKRGMA
jgi:hypothetical protein